MADVTIDNNASSILDKGAVRGGIFWTSPTVGYIIYADTSHDLVYKKTSDGGATWAVHVDIAAPGACATPGYDCYADWQTAGDAGTKIHIAYVDADDNEIRYIYLDTSNDSVGGLDTIEACQGTGVFRGGFQYNVTLISITKTRGGNLAIAFKYQDNSPAYFYGFYTSPDATTWTSKTNPYAAGGDYCLLFPGNETDNQDIWAAYWDISEDDILLRTFDNSGNSWSAGTAINADMVETTSFLNMDGAVRLSDGHLLFVAWNLYDNANADLKAWDINGEGSITAKTDVLTDSAESFLVSVFINQATNDIYITYMIGTAISSLVAVFYKKSTDGGANWGVQSAIQANAEDDERWISSGAVKVTWGGKFLPVWFNNDLYDLYVNTDNGISIPAVSGVVGPFPTHFRV